jgi:hypothetical protein
MSWRLRWHRSRVNRWCLARKTQSPCRQWVDSPATLHPLPPAAMAHDHPDAPKQFGIRLSDDTMELVSAIQEFRQRTKQPTTLSAVVEDAIQCHYNRLVKEGAISDD